MAKKKQNKTIIKPLSPASKSIDKKNLDDFEYPLFCFQYLQENSIKGSRDFDFFYNFLIRLKKLSELGWKEIGTSPRHAFGTEKIPVEKIKPNIPSVITPDISEFTVFRANGDNRAFLGFRKKNVFHVVFIEAVFNDIYDHG